LSGFKTPAEPKPLKRDTPAGSPHCLCASN
jgi:hypothetical protein